MKDPASNAIVNGTLHDTTGLIRQWALGADACSQLTIALLDAQSAWLKDMEQAAAQYMAPWFGATGLPPSAQPLVDAAQGMSSVALVDAMQKSWAGWGQVWLNALRHDLPAGP